MFNIWIWYKLEHFWQLVFYANYFCQIIHKTITSSKTKKSGKNQIDLIRLLFVSLSMSRSICIVVSINFSQDFGSSAKCHLNTILIPCMNSFSEKEMLPNWWCHIVGKIVWIWAELECNIYSLVIKFAIRVSLWLIVIYCCVKYFVIYACL